MDKEIKVEINGKENKFSNQKVNAALKGKLNKLTYRQYLALVFIATKLNAISIYPSKDEIKNRIGFSTDRMLKITLEALEKKGFIRFYGLKHTPILEITKETKNTVPLFIDKLFLINNFTSYPELKNKISYKEKKDYLDISVQLLPNNEYFKFLNNKKKIVNRWYTLLEDFPPSLVWEKLEKYGISSNHIVLDPFVGSGTTIVTSMLYGTNVIGIDVNPVATFVTKVKTTWNINLRELKREANSLLNDLDNISPFLDEVRITTPSLENIPKMERYQWLKPRTQNDVAFVKERISEIANEKIRNLLLLALVEAAQESSNVSFCPGTSFYPFKKKPTFFEAFKRKLRIIYEDLLYIKKYDWADSIPPPIYPEDMRKMTEFIEPNSIDFIFTSPPYPNDLEYTRQTRLDLYLLDYVKEMRDVTKIKKKMVKGSTKLIYKESNSAKYVREIPKLQEITQKLKEAFKDKKWGWNYPRMIQEYFGDIFLALRETKKVLRKDRYAHFVVGDQTYKGILIPVGQIMLKMANKMNYSSFELETFRVRRSTLHSTPLKEEIVILRK